MMTSSRPRQEITGSFPSRRGHTSQLSISDPSHHVTEAIGTLYGDEDDSGSESGRPLSFICGSQYHEQLHRTSLPDLHERPEPQRPEPQRPAIDPPRRRSVPDQPPEPPISQAEHSGLRKAHTVVVPPSQRAASPYEHGSKSPASPTPSLRDVQADPSGSQFPLTNIDNPSDIAQELSNLQALRRLSMDVGNNIDPEMPPMGLSAMPVVAPSGDDDENDPSRLLWVPARVHPELAPTEFKSFLEKRVQLIRRRSGDSFLSADGNSGFCGQELSLRRNKSMLSRQIDNTGGRGAVGYVDGAERLERQRSSGGQDNSELSLEELVKDPTKAVQRLAQETHGASRSMEDGGDDDIPILPMAPGAGLRRSTRTTYRKGGSVRSGDRGSLSRRFVRHPDGESSENDSSSSGAPRGLISQRVQYKSIADNQPRPAGAGSTRRHNNLSTDASHAIPGLDSLHEDSVERQSSSRAPADQLPIRAPTASASTQDTAVTSDRVDRHENQASQSFPQRSSSQAARTSWDHHPETIEDNATRPGRRPPSNKTKHAIQHQYTVKSPNPSTAQTMSDTLASPSSLTGADASRTDSLTFIPTLSQPEKKQEKRSKRDKDDDSSGNSSRSGSAWKWLKGVTDDRDRKKEEGRRAKARASVEKSQDNARLDVIQNSIDKNTGKGRESLVLDRDNVDHKLLEERKESHRKSDSKKDKDGSIFSSIFGGSRKKEEKEKVHKRSQYLQVPEDVPCKPLTPDVDYHWARFPLLEERAIYRMAHIKLANPRRPLLSQVLLSNFMYSYLAIVQAMHPQMNVPTSPQQKRLEEEARRKRQEQEYLARQQMQEDHGDDHGLDQYNFDYHRATVQYAECGSNGPVDYVDDAQIYEDEHGDDRQDDYRYEGIEGFSRDTKDYLDSRGDKDDHRRQGQDDMW